MDWKVEQQWIAHRTGSFSYHIRIGLDYVGAGPNKVGVEPAMKYLAVQIERRGMNTNTTSVGAFDTLEEAQTACDEAFLRTVDGAE